MAVKWSSCTGIGDGDPRAGWLEGLNRGLTQAGHEPIDRTHTLAPRYSSILSTDGIGAEMPPVTYRAKDDAGNKLRVRATASPDPTDIGAAVHAVGDRRPSDPEGPLNAAQGFAVENVAAYDLTQVRRYVRNEPLRGAILRHLLDQDYDDEIVLIGHSLGSVIAIDLLDHLPETVHVRRFITIGSPAAAPSSMRAVSGC